MRPGIMLRWIIVPLLAVVPQPASAWADDFITGEVRPVTLEDETIDVIDSRTRQVVHVDVGDHPAEVERDHLQLEAARIDLREVEDVVHDRDEGPGGARAGLRVLPLLGRQIGVEQQLGPADDAARRSAHLVAHGGEELTPRPRHVLRRRGVALLLASPLARARARQLEVDLASVAGSGPQGAVTAADLELSPREPDHRETEVTVSEGDDRRAALRR